MKTESQAHTTRILGLSGSLRSGSSNMAILQTAKALLPTGAASAASAELEIFPSLGALPHFNPDLDREGDAPPPAIAEFRNRIDAAHAVLISTPEYAHGIPGVLKNALDWLVSHPGFVGKPVGILFGSASEGSFAKEALLEVLKTMSARVVPQAVLTIAGSRVRVDEAGLKRILDALTKEHR